MIRNEAEQREDELRSGQTRGGGRPRLTGRKELAGCSDARPDHLSAHATKGPQKMHGLSTKQSPRSDSAEAPTALGSIAKLLSTLGCRYCGITDQW